jgi:hypothetical protein
MGSKQVTQAYTVVIIDDKEVCCRRIAQKIQGSRTIGDVEFTIIAEPVHVGVQSKGEADPGGWTFTTETLAALSRAAGSGPDLLIVDYIYIDDEVAADLIRRGPDVTRAERELRSLTPRNLRDWVENHAEMDARQRQMIVERIFDFKGPLYLHSRTPRGLEHAIGTVKERGNDAEIAFPNVPKGFLEVKDTRDLLFADDEFDRSDDVTFYDREYYAYQLGVLFDEIVQKEIYKRNLHRGKFLRLRRSAPVLAVIGGIGAGVGFASSVAGAFAYELVREGHLFWALAVFGLIMIVAVPLGWAVAKVFEELMARLLPDR